MKEGALGRPLSFAANADPISAVGNNLAVDDPDLVALAPCRGRGLLQGTRGAIFKAHGNLVIHRFLGVFLDLVTGHGATDRAQHRHDITTAAGSDLMTQYAAQYATRSSAKPATLALLLEFTHRLDDATVMAQGPGCCSHLDRGGRDVISRNRR